MIIKTANLHLVPLNLSQFEMLLTSKEELIKIMKLNGDLEPLTQEMQTAFEWLYKQCKNYPKHHIWNTVWLIIKKTDNTPIGSFCFKGEPDFNGEVEIGYCIYKAYQKHGYMSETIDALIKWISKNKDVRVLLAETNQTNLQSQNVLIKNGFIKYSEKDNMFWWKKALH